MSPPLLPQASINSDPKCGRERQRKAGHACAHAYTRTWHSWKQQEFCFSTARRALCALQHELPRRAVLQLLGVCPTVAWAFHPCSTGSRAAHGRPATWPMRHLVPNEDRIRHFFRNHTRNRVCTGLHSSACRPHPQSTTRHHRSTRLNQPLSLVCDDVVASSPSLSDNKGQPFNSATCV